MKKVLSLFVLLCTVFAGAWAQSFSVATNTTNYNAIETGHYYAFRECQNNGHYLNGADNKTTNIGKNQVYKIVDAGGGKVWLQCYGTDEYIGLGASKDNGNKYNVAMVTSSEDAVAFTLSQRGSAAQVVLDCYPNDGSTKFWLGAQSANTSYPAHYQNGGTGTLSYWSVFEVTFSTMVEYTINYRSTNNHSWQTTYNGIENTTLSIDDINVDFYSNFKFENSDLQLREDNKSFNVTCEEVFPFTVGQPCRMQTKRDVSLGGDFYVHTDGNAYAKAGVTSYEDNKIVWVIEHAAGTPDIFTVRSFYNNKYLTLASSTEAGQASMQGSPAGTSLAPFNSESTSYFRVKRSTHNETLDGFCLTHPKREQMCMAIHYEPSNHSTIGYGVGGWGNGDVDRKDNAVFVFPVESFTANLAATDGTDHYGSIYLPYTMTLPENVEAYAAAHEGEVLKLTKVGEAGAVIPEGAYILYSASETSATLALGATNPVTVESNALDGKFQTGVKLPEGNNYVLNNKDGVGFYKYSKATYPVAKAVFYAGESLVSAFRFDFETEQTTSIESLIQNMKLQGEVFDLQGRRLNKAQQGMNIINGHKVLVK